MFIAAGVQFAGDLLNARVLLVCCWCDCSCAAGVTARVVLKGDLNARLLLVCCWCDCSCRVDR